MAHGRRDEALRALAVLGQEPDLERKAGAGAGAQAQQPRNGSSSSSSSAQAGAWQALRSAELRSQLGIGKPTPAAAAWPLPAPLCPCSGVGHATPQGWGSRCSSSSAASTPSCEHHPHLQAAYTGRIQALKAVYTEHAAQ
jgi:hypothetical protein